jgi:uncharacterized protein YuzE
VTETTRRAFRVTHDQRTGCSYLYVAGPVAKGAAVRQVQAGDDVILDFDADGRLLGVELLNRRLIHPVTLAEAAAGPRWASTGHIEGDRA